MRIVCWQTILMNYRTLFLTKTRKDVACCSRDWRFKGQEKPIHRLRQTISPEPMLLAHTRGMVVFLAVDQIITSNYIFVIRNKREVVMRGSRRFCRRGSNFDNVFFFILMRGEERIQMSL